MQTIISPKKIEFKKEKGENQAVVSVEPCYPGYGVTLGNSLRRVLLSSLPGAAAIGVKIKGADHEFMALPHIKEDVLEIVLNLKKLRLKIHSEEPIKLTLDVYGEKEVKAGMIEKNSQVEIINPDLTLAHITDMAGNLNMEIFVSRGMGYETIEERDRSEKHEIGYLEIDSIFSPVFSVGLNIENVRVGKMTNWERLILNITTDGTIAPKDAFKKAVEILVSQFNSLISAGEAIDEEGDNKETEEIKTEEQAEEIKKENEEPEEALKKKRGRPKKSE